MKLSEKRRTVQLLEKLRFLNLKYAFVYKIAYQRENRLMIKDFYKKLHLQKLEFLQNIEEMIEQLKKEISPIPDPELLSFYHKKKLKASQLYLKYKSKQSYADTFKREMKGLEKYKKYLSKINHGCVREVLLSHKHQIKMTLREMTSTGLMKYPVG